MMNDADPADFSKRKNPTTFHKESAVNKKGFTLIELLLYLAMLTLISHLVFSFVTQRAGQVGQEGKKLTRQAQALVAFDLVVRDIRIAPSRAAAWKKITPHECVWYSAQKQKDICWMVQKNTLVRIAGQYDETTGKWKSKRKDVAAAGVKDILFDVVRKNHQVMAVCSTLEMESDTQPCVLKQWITIRERIL